MDNRFASVLGEGRQLYVAVPTRTGPHVTPELYGWAGGELWFAAAASTLKARHLSDGTHVGALVRSGVRSVVLSGQVTSYDPKSAFDVVRGIRSVAVARGTLSFVTRNVADLAAFPRDYLAGRAGGLVPARRILYRLRPDRAALLEDDEVVGVSGTWPGTVAQRAEERRPDAPARGAQAVLAWETEAGAIALPARWDLDANAAHVPAGLVVLAALPRHARASVVVDEYGAPGPAQKEGLLFRGDAHLMDDGATGRAHFEGQTVTAWNGVTADTEPYPA